MHRPVIVVGLKEKQPTALRFAASAARPRQATVRVVHCTDLRAASDFVSVPYTTFPPASWRAAGEVLLDEARGVLGELDPKPDADYLLVDGLPYPTLRGEAAHAAMLVVGVDAAGWFGPLFRGSVTERLITRSVVPVAVVPERADVADLTGPIFVAIDARTPATGPLRFAFTEADRTSTELHVAHVIAETDMFFQSQSHKVDVAEVLAGWREQYPDVTVRHRFFFDDASDGCLRASEEASLLILGRRRTQVFGHPVLSQIAHGAHCPYVVVPDAWEAQ